MLLILSVFINLKHLDGEWGVYKYIDPIYKGSPIFTVAMAPMKGKKKELSISVWKNNPRDPRMMEDVSVIQMRAAMVSSKSYELSVVYPEERTVGRFTLDSHTRSTGEFNSSLFFQAELIDRERIQVVLTNRITMKIDAFNLWKGAKAPRNWLKIIGVGLISVLVLEIFVCLCMKGLVKKQEEKMELVRQRVALERMAAYKKNQ